MKKYLYFGCTNWDTTFSDDKEDLILMESHAINQEDAENTFYSFRLTFENDILEKVEYAEQISQAPKDFKLSERELETGYYFVERPLEEKEKTFRYREFKEIEWDNFVLNEEGLSSIGGAIPQDCVLPTHEKIKVQCQYIAKISKQEQSLEWLPFDLHIFYPLYSDISPLYFDYSNPNTPTIIDTPNLSNISYVDEVVKADTFIEFEKKQISTIQPKDDKIEFVGLTGIPDWVQCPEIPLCPYTQQPMKFVANFWTSDKIKVSNHNVIRDKKADYFSDFLDFWGYGILYIFMSPTTKTVAVFIQNT